VALLLAVAVFLQRSTIVDAIGQMGRLSAGTLAVLAGLAVVERLSRADVIRSLLPGTSIGRAVVIGDVGSAASKGIPAGGPIATVLRWQVARDGGTGVVAFLTMLIASGVMTAFVSWGYPLAATLVDASGRTVDLADAAIIVVSIGVLSGSAAFWVLVLRSDRAQAWAVGRSRSICMRFASMVPAVADVDAESVVLEVRAALRAIARRPFPLFLRTAVAQGNGAIVLWVTLQGLGVGPELGATEFFRVFFVAHVLGSLAPTPGGVGVIEAGLTGALVAAGVATDVALAGVLVYRLITYVTPIVVGTLLYLGWRRQRVAGVPARTPSPEFLPDPATR
jgi:uncharacterized membrane protein YbhN (UPF0104 family)